jgi:hypothetical protein
MSMTSKGRYSPSILRGTFSRNDGPSPVLQEADSEPNTKTEEACPAHNRFKLVMQ